MRQIDCINNSMDMNVSKLQDTVEDSLVCYSPWSRRVGHDLAMKQQQHSYIKQAFVSQLSSQGILLKT